MLSKVKSVFPSILLWLFCFGSIKSTSSFQLSKRPSYTNIYNKRSVCCPNEFIVWSKKEQEENDQQEEVVQKNPFQGIIEMFSNFDDVVDDFLYKRMGNGEVFYGKRKYKPSGRPNTDGKYQGLGISDQVRIEQAKERKQQRLQEMLLRKQQNVKK